MDVRLASSDDLDAVVDLADFVDPPSHGMDVDRDYYASIVEQGRLTVAEASGIVIGYGGAIPVAGARHVTDLFVHPDAHGRGIGRGLLNAVWDADVADAPRQTFSSLHPSALPLYIRAGMLPRWELLYLEGDPSALPPTHLTTRDLAATDAASLEQAWLGWDRITQYTYWSTRPGARTIAVLDGATPVAVGCLSRSRTTFTLLHLSAIDRAVMVDALNAVAGLTPAELMIAAPGHSVVVSHVIAAGWRVVDRDIYCASEAELFDADRLLLHPGLL